MEGLWRDITHPLTYNHKGRGFDAGMGRMGAQNEALESLGEALVGKNFCVYVISL